MTTTRNHLTRRIALTSLASAILVSLSGHAQQLDRLQPLTADDNAVFLAPGAALSDGVRLGDELLFSVPAADGSDIRQTLYAANRNQLRGVRDQNGSTIRAATEILPFLDTVVVSERTGVNTIGPGDPNTTFISGSSAARQMLAHGNSSELLYVLGLDGSLAVFDGVNNTEISGAGASGNTDCPDGATQLAGAGNITVLYPHSFDGGLTTVLGFTQGTSAPQPVPQDGVFTSPCSLTRFNNRIFFTALNTSNNRQIYRTDGLNESELEVFRFNGDAGPQLFNPEGNGTSQPAFREFNGRKLFAASAFSNNSYDLWITDGTTGGTERISELGAGLGTIRPDLGFEFGGQLFFPANGTLMRTDGSAANTAQVTLTDGTPISVGNAVSLTEFDGLLHFIDSAGQILRLATIDGNAEVITGISQTANSINGDLGDILLASTDTAVLTMIADPVVSSELAVSVQENLGGQGILEIAITMDPIAPYDVTGTFATNPGTALNQSDFIPGSGTFTITAGTPQTTLSIPIVDDTEDDDNENFTITLGSLSGARFTDRSAASEIITVTIQDDDQPLPAGQLQVAAQSFDEGAGQIGIVVTVGGTVSAPVEFSYEISPGSATSADFSGALSGSGMIGTGLNSTEIPLTLTDDTIDEAAETFTVTVTPVSGTTTTDDVTGSIQINDNDEPASTETPPTTSDSGGGGAFGGALVLIAGLAASIRRRRLTLH